MIFVSATWLNIMLCLIHKTEWLGKALHIRQLFVYIYIVCTYFSWTWG